LEVDDKSLDVETHSLM